MRFACLSTRFGAGIAGFFSEADFPKSGRRVPVSGPSAVGTRDER